MAQLLTEAYQQYAKIFPAEWPFYLQDIMNVHSRWGDAELIVADIEKRLVGTVTLYLKKGKSSREEWPPAWAGIRLLAVRPDYRGQGIGRGLMDECIWRCRKAGVKTLGLHTTEFMDIARGMYERMGFQRVPEFDFHPTSNVTVMAYRLEL